MIVEQEYIVKLSEIGKDDKATNKAILSYLEDAGGKHSNIAGYGLLDIPQTHLTWLFDTRLAMPVLIFVSVWKLIGYNVVLFLTGFSTINQNVYEAAKIDGAGAKEIFFKITIPILKPTICFVTLVTAISSFQIFDLIYVMTEGGPNNSTNVIVYSIYKYAFEYFDVGQACALAYILFIVIFVLAVLQKLCIKEG